MLRDGRGRMAAALIGACAGLGLGVQTAWPADDSCTENAMLVIDASGSMVQKDRNGLPLIDGARSAARQILPFAARNRKLGLTTLGPGSADQCSNVLVRVAPQEDAAAPIIQAIDGLVTDGGTPLSSAVEVAANALDFQNQRAVVVVVSDGDETCGRDPCEVARTLKAQSADLTIHVIGFKGDHGATVSATCLADETGGMLQTAEDSEELAAALGRTLMCPQLADAAARRR